MDLIIKRRLQKEIEKVNTLLQEELKDSSPIFDQFVTPLVISKGKQLRAKLCLLIALSGHSDERQRIIIASAIELLHLATLVHDDVIDEADVRRGVSTIHSTEGNKTAILSGDYLFAKAFTLIGRAGELAYLKIFTKVIVDLVEGEFLQMEDVASVDQGIERYLLKTQKKTADLITTAIELGARMGGYGEEEVQKFKVFGNSLGMLFQVTDDIMDYTGIEEITGKPAGKDLREGLLTHPLLSILTDENKASIAVQIQAIMAGESPNALMAFVKEQGGLEKTKALALHYESEAKSALEALPNFAGKDILYDSLVSLMNRSK